MKISLLIFTIVLLLSCGGGGSDSSSSSSASALCNDGTYSYSQNCSGTCSSHGGVKTWFNNCGSSSKTAALNISPLSEENMDSHIAKSFYTGSWEGTWISKKYDQGGLCSITISEKGLLVGKFLNSDNSLNSKIHGYELEGIATVFIDYDYPPDSGKIEYQGNTLLNMSDGNLIGRIVIQEIGSPELREFEIRPIQK